MTEPNTIEISKPNVCSILVVSRKDWLLRGFPDKHNLFDNFYSYLILFLFSRKKGDRASLLDEALQNGVKQQIENDLIQKGHLKFLDWIINYPQQTELYPERELCLHNIAENDRLVLQKNGEILVRMPDRNEKHLNFDYLGETNSEIEEFFDKKYENIIFKYRIEDYVRLDAIISSSKDLFELIIKVVEIKQKTIKFKREYLKDSYNTFPNILYPDSLLSRKDYFPLIPYNAFDSRLVFCTNFFELSAEKSFEFYENNEENFLALLLKFISLADKKLLYCRHECNIEAKQLGIKRFFPRDFSKTNADKFLYIEELLKNLQKDYPHISVFRLEYFKAKAILQLIEKRKEDYVQDTQNEADFIGLYAFLRNYHSLYKEKEEAKQLLFDVHVEPKDNSLKDLYLSIYESIDKFVHSLENPDSCRDTSLSELVLKELEKIDKIIHDFSPQLGLENIDSSKLSKCTITYDTIRNELTLNREVIYEGEEAERNDHSIYIYKTYHAKDGIKKVKLIDFPNLERSLTYYINNNDQCLIIIVDDILRKSYETINYRKSSYQKAQKIKDRSKIECFENTYEFDRMIRMSTSVFQNAINVLSNHYCHESYTKIEDRLISWLKLFKDKDDVYVKSLLHIIAAHESITQEDVRNFFTEIQENIKHYGQSSIYFTFNEANDHNGLYRLLDSSPEGQDILRTHLCLDRFVDKVLALNENHSKQLIILSETGISGIQSKKALIEYYFSETYRSELQKKRRYHAIGDAKLEDFRNKLRSFKKITFITLLYTDKYQKELTQVCSELFRLPSDDIQFIGARKIKFEDCLLKNNRRIERMYQEKFLELIRDIDYIQDIFELTNEQRRHYENSLDSEEHNLIVRLNSVPKWAFELFCLKPPKNQYVEPLFNRIPEHK